MAEKVMFTKTALEALIEDHERERVVVNDKKQPGLIAELRPGGTLTFYLYRWADGRPHRIRIGAFPAVSIDQARDKATTLLADLVRGIDPAALKRQRRQEPTFADLFAQWLEHAKENKRTWAEDERQYKTLLTGWKLRRLSTITRRDIQARHKSIKKAHGKYAANRALALLSAMFGRAGDDPLNYDGPNPCKGVRKWKEETRDRFLQPHEMPAFFEAVEAEPNKTIADFFLACLYTGARRGNVAAMRWADLNLDTATWRIPQTKSGDPVTVHLSAPALSLLKARKEIAEPGAEFVFPGRRSNGKTQHLSSPKDAWKRLVQRAGLTDLRMHDLRRSMGSFMVAAGASLPVIGKALGHKPGSPVTAIYARLNLDPVRASVDLATAAILAAAKTEAKVNGN